MERIDKVIYATTFKNNDITSLILVFNDENDHPYLLYADDIVSFFTLSERREEVPLFDNSLKLISVINSQLIIDFLNDRKEKDLYTIIDLKPPKPITKKEIEEELGYKIQIIDE